MTRNIDVYDGHPDKALEAFAKDPSVNGITKTERERDLLRQFLNWATLPALYQEDVERFDAKDPSINERVANALELISATLTKINVNMVNISRNSNRIGMR